MKVLFVDIDGVLNNHSCYGPGKPGGANRIDPRCIAQLNRITDATGALIVVSSTWRLDKSRADLRELFANWGGSPRWKQTTPSQC